MTAAKGIYFFLLFCLSAVAFEAYAVDKEKAKRGERRISERALLRLSFFGGAAGVADQVVERARRDTETDAAMFVFRHKTRKFRFHLVNLPGLRRQIAAATALLTVAIRF